jgi:hypothetical protein
MDVVVPYINPENFSITQYKYDVAHSRGGVCGVSTRDHLLLSREKLNLHGLKLSTSLEEASLPYIDHAWGVQRYLRTAESAMLCSV